jgi:rod shape-determining protein MreC
MAVPIKALGQRFAFLFLVLTAFGLMILSKAETVVVERVSTVVVDVFSPFMDVMSQPAAAVNDAIRTIRELAALREENQRLRRENSRLLTWQEAARRLSAQNASLQALLDYKPDAKSRYIAARVIGDSGGAFVRSVLVGAGESDGVRKNQSVVTGYGLAGRVAAVGYRSARVLLITDINSRVPVVIQSSKLRAILAGDNSSEPRLQFLPANVTIKPGSRVVTSGHGGIFPPGLSVGRVMIGVDGILRLKPHVAFERLEFVRIVDSPRIAPVSNGGRGANEGTSR